MKPNQQGLASQLRVLVVSIGMATSIGALAASPFPAGGEIAPNEEYLITEYDVVATFTPRESGEIMYTCSNFVIPCTNETQYSEDNIMPYIFQGYTDFGKSSLKVEKGVPVYFQVTNSADWFLSEKPIFKVSVDEEIELISLSDPEGSVISLTSGFSDLILTFNQPVKAGRAILHCKNSSLSIPTDNTYSVNLSLNYVDQLMSLFENGTLQGGEDIEFIITGITNSAGHKYNGGKELTLTFRAPAKPVYLVNIKYPDPFKAYWEKGDPEAVLRAEYSGNISKAIYTLIYGNRDAQLPTLYTEEGSSDGSPEGKSPVVIDGNIVTIDFAGVYRTPSDMGVGEFSDIYLKLMAWDDSDQLVMTGEQGSVGSVSETLPYYYHQPSVLNPVYTPASGTSLRGVKELKLTYDDYTVVNFEGVDFTIEGGETITVPESETTHVIGSGADWLAITYTIPVPEAVQKTNSKVTVTLSGDPFIHEEDKALAAEFEAIYFAAPLPLNYDYKVLPASGEVISLLNFEINCPDFDTTLSGEGGLQIILEKYEDEAFTQISSVETADIVLESGVAKFSLPREVSEPGTYFLTIPEGLFIFSNDDSTATMLNGVMTLEYSIKNYTGINIPAAPGTLYDVYSVEGVKVKSDADFDALKSLPRGLYIINGKKVIL